MPAMHHRGVAGCSSAAALGVEAQGNALSAGSKLQVYERWKQNGSRRLPLCQTSRCRDRYEHERRPVWEA